MMPRLNRIHPSTIAAASLGLPRLAICVVLGALLLGSCATPLPSPSASPESVPSSSPASSPSSSASPAASPAACTSADITASGGPWGGAAGSRGSDLVVENRGAAACLLPAAPTIALVDPGGTVLLANTPPQAGTGPSIAPGGTFGFSLLFGNWCNQLVTLPLHFRLAMAADAVDIANLAVTTTDELPPCNGPGQPASLSTTAWEPR